MTEPAKQRVIVDDINLGGLLLFPRIWSAVPMALQPPRLALALLLIALLMVGGGIWDSVAGPTFHKDGLIYGPAAGEQGIGPFQASVTHATASFNRLVQGLVLLELPTAWDATHSLVLRMPALLWREAPWFTAIYGLFFVAVMSIGGGALARMTVCQFTGRARLTATEALQFAAGSWWRLALTPLLPLALVAVMAIVLMAAGWLLLLPFMDLIGGPLYGLALLIGLLMAFLLLVYVVALALMVPAVATENCDPFESLQRSYGYVLARPLHLLGYGVVALAGLALGYLLVHLFAGTTLNLTAACAGTWVNEQTMAGTGGSELATLSAAAAPSSGATDLSWHQRWARGWMGFWETLMSGVVVAFVISYVYAASTIVYLLMRRAADGQDVGEIWEPGMVPGTSAPSAAKRPRISDADEAR